MAAASLAGAGALRAAPDASVPSFSSALESSRPISPARRGRSSPRFRAISFRSPAIPSWRDRRRFLRLAGPSAAALAASSSLRALHPRVRLASVRAEVVLRLGPRGGPDRDARGRPHVLRPGDADCARSPAPDAARGVGSFVCRQQRHRPLFAEAVVLLLARSLPSFVCPNRERPRSCGSRTCDRSRRSILRRPLVPGMEPLAETSAGRVLRRAGGRPAAPRGFRRPGRPERRSSARAALADPAFDPESEAILEGAAPPLTAEGFGGASAVETGPDREVVDATASSPALLVRSETFDPNWTARIDGREARVVPADFAFQAVALPAGRHRVVFRYRNSLVLWGMFASLATLFGCALALRGMRGGRSPG